MYKKIVLAYDGSQSSQLALLNCKEFSQRENAKVHLLTVVPYDLVTLGPEMPYYTSGQEKIEWNKYFKILNNGIEQLTNSGVVAQGALCIGDPVDQIINYAQKISSDLIVLGHKHQSNWIQRWWRRSISKALIEKSPCSVLVVILKSEMSQPLL